MQNEYTVNLNRQQVYLLIESVQSYINDCIDEYHKLNKDDEQYESDRNYFEKKITDLLSVRKSLFDAANKDAANKDAANKDAANKDGVSYE